MREIEDKKDIEMQIKEIIPKIAMTVLIIDGKTLDSIISFGDILESQFFEIAIKAPCVCVCRCSPT